MHHQDCTNRKSLNMASSSLDAPAGVTRPVVFFDVSIGETHAGRIKMGQLSIPLHAVCKLMETPELFSDMTPK